MLQRRMWRECSLKTVKFEGTGPDGDYIRMHLRAKAPNYTVSLAGSIFFFIFTTSRFRVYILKARTNVVDVYEIRIFYMIKKQQGRR